MDFLIEGEEIRGASVGQLGLEKLSKANGAVQRKERARLLAAVQIGRNSHSAHRQKKMTEEHAGGEY